MHDFCTLDRRNFQTFLSSILTWSIRFTSMAPFALSLMLRTPLHFLSLSHIHSRIFVLSPVRRNWRSDTSGNRRSTDSRWFIFSFFTNRSVVIFDEFRYLFYTSARNIYCCLKTVNQFRIRSPVSLSRRLTPPPCSDSRITTLAR